MNQATNDHFETESLERFIGELEAHGFTPLEGVYPIQAWRGKIHSAFEGLTDAKSMDIGIRAGWPFSSPVLFIQGLATNHSMLGGHVCLWQDDDDSLQWMTLDGFYDRIEEWCSRTQTGWRGDERLQQDAYLNFHPKISQVATFDWSALKISSGAWGEAHGVIDERTGRVDIKPGAGRRVSNRLKVLWFHAEELDGPPPRSLSEINRHLSRKQRKEIQRALDSHGRPREFIILFCWERGGVPNILPILTRAGAGNEAQGAVMLSGPNDEQNLILRAGPDSAQLQKCKATLFGAGALGGHVALLLAQSGVGVLNIVDADRLLPGNVARHIAGHRQVGLPKAQAVQSIVKERAPWTKIRAYSESPMTPEEMRRRVANSDIAIDSTGNGAFSKALSFLAEIDGKAIVSGALHRGGAVGRVRRYASPGDLPIHQRHRMPEYPHIPTGNESAEFSSPETGCSAPVNNAPPTSVAACASLIAQVAIDALTERFAHDDEVIDVYFPLDERPFNRMGRVDINGKSAD